MRGGLVSSQVRDVGQKSKQGPGRSPGKTFSKFERFVAFSCILEGSENEFRSRI